MELRDKVIVVTGAASGIGRALVKRFVAEGAKHVVSADVNLASAQETARLYGGTAAACDVAKENEVQALIEATENDIGPIDLFCSNAGVGAGRDLFAPNAEWTLCWEVNVMAHVYAARHLVPRMLQRGGGYFLHTASAAGLLNQIGGAAYGVTKHASVGFAEWLALSYKDQGIRVSVLCPQAVRTPMTATDEAASRAAAVDGMMEPDELTEVVVRDLAAEKFCILPHEEVMGYLHKKVADYDRWIASMNRLHQRLTAAGS